MNEITINQKCLVLRNGIEIWIAEDRANNFIQALNTNQQFIDFEGRLINKVDVLGIFTPQDLDEHTKRKNGQWKCKHNVWYDKNVECTCNRTSTGHFNAMGEWID